MADHDPPKVELAAKKLRAQFNIIGSETDWIGTKFSNDQTLLVKATLEAMGRPDTRTPLEKALSALSLAHDEVRDAKDAVRTADENLDAARERVRQLMQDQKKET